MIDRSHGGNITEFMERYQIPKDEIIDFSANINPLGLSRKVKDVILKNLDIIAHYPHPTSSNLKRTLATFHSIRPENLLITNGSIELIYLIPKVFLPKSVIILIPTFSEYEFAVKLNGAKPIFLKLQERDNFKIDMDKIKRFMPRAELIFICNPNNPTGNLFSKGDMLDLIELCKKYDTTLVVDESSIDFVENVKNVTLLTEATKKKYLLVLRTLTKFFALAGLRLGYLIAHRDIIKRITKFQYPWAVNSLAQIALEVVINDNDYINRSRQFVFKERWILWKKLKAIKKLHLYPPTSNFILCKLTDKEVDVEWLFERLAQRGIIIRSCKNFRGLNNKFFRIAVRKREENNKLISALRDIL